jgi:hypothetical protein
MYQYKFIQIKCSKFTGKFKEDYHSVINYNAKEGWRLVQILDRSFSERFMELIFEKEINS